MEIMEKKNRRKGLGAVAGILLAISLVVGGFALTNAITIPTDSNVGDGAEDVTDLVVTNVDYTLNTTDPDVVDAIEFDIAPALNGTLTPKVYVQPDSVAGTWYDCDVTNTAHPVCDTTGIRLEALAIDKVRVVAAD